MGNIEKTESGNSEVLLRTYIMDPSGGEERVEITKKDLDSVVAVERENIEKNEDFFMQNFERFNQILDTEYLIRINKKLESGVSYDYHSLSLIQEQEGEVIVPGLTPGEALIWGVKVLDFVRTGTKTGDVRYIEDFSKSFQEIYERRLSQLRFDYLDPERGIFTGVLGGSFNFLLAPSKNPNVRRFDVNLLLPESSPMDDLNLEFPYYNIFLAKYGLIFELIMKCPELQVKGDIVNQDYKEDMFHEALRAKKANLLATFDEFLKE
jgi:hypothetical protein